MTSDVKIRVSRNTRAALLARGKKGESYDRIIYRLMRFWDLAELELPRIHLEKLQAEASEAVEV